MIDLNEKNVGIGSEKRRVLNSIREKLTCVRIWFNEQGFQEICELAQKAGSRPHGIKPWTLKPHGFEGERVACTKGLSKFLKKECLGAWKREQEYKEKQRRDLEEKAKELGVELK